MKNKLTQTELKRQLHYNPDTGLFTWLVNKKGKVRIGDIAGCLNKDGYVFIGINGNDYYAHRLAHLYMEGYWPEHGMDHKFGIKDDNRWSEINHTTQMCNLQNQKINKNNTSGFPGVVWHKAVEKWLARITLDNKKIHLGYYKTPLDAALARFTFEMQCPLWKCDYQSSLAKAIKIAWPEFQFGV